MPRFQLLTEAALIKNNLDNVSYSVITIEWTLDSALHVISGLELNTLVDEGYACKLLKRE